MKISREEYIGFLQHMLKFQYENLLKGECRLGQVFLNKYWKYLDLKEPDPELFYCEDRGRCIDLIRERYVNL